MKDGKTTYCVYGTTRQEEEEQLAKIIQIAQDNLDNTRQYNKELTEELKDMQESYDTRDKEILTLWHNTESRYQESKKDLMRCLKARTKPYFGRIDFIDSVVKKEESYYIGRVGIKKNSTEPIVIDWRTPVASVYYENTIGKCTYEVKNQGTYHIDLKRKRTYEIADDKLIDYYDSDVVANDELLTKYLAKSKKAVLSEIIGTIQKEQNTIIRRSPKTNLIVQGVAGSGKTTVAMHRISYILYNYEQFRPEDFYIIGSNRILLNYITSVLPDLDVYGISQMTMEQLFVRLLYEDWDDSRYTISSLTKRDESACIKGKQEWFQALKTFCENYEGFQIPKTDVVIEKSGVLLLSKERILSYLEENDLLSMQEKINGLNELLGARLENELLGKEVSYSKEDRKSLEKQMKFHFGKEEWKGSIFALYEEFLKSQQEKGCKVTAPQNSYDLYDLAALAYLYKRIKETDGIREASHIIIDEAQDFGMMAYEALYYCLRGCTYTIMGDVSQNIHYGYGLNDWEALKRLILTGPYDSFGLLRKSYRNTIEISEFATHILRHGNFPVYPVEPILRHGSPVKLASCVDAEELLSKAATQIIQWQKEGYETIAVVCRDKEEAQEVTLQLKRKVKLIDCSIEDGMFEQGVMVLSVEYTKGLEFDAVLIYHPSKQSYPEEDQYVKLLYVAATRALHALSVLFINDLTDLIAKPPKERNQQQLPLEGQQQLEKNYQKVEFVVDEGKKQEELKKLVKRTQRNYTANEKEIKKPIVKPEVVKPVVKPKPVLQQGALVKKNQSPHMFNEVPDTSILYPKGHAGIDSNIRWAKKTKQYMEFTSRYGILRLTPISESIIRVQFQRGQEAEFNDGYFSKELKETISFRARESTTQYEVATKEFAVRIDKRSGALSFLDLKGVLLLNENKRVPRQVELDHNGIKTWNFFDWTKEDRLKAKGILDDTLEIMNLKARYISFGQKEMRMPLLVSAKGYGLSIAAEHTVMCCSIPMYGQYVYTDGMGQIDYYFIYGKTIPDTIKLYHTCCKR